MVERLACRPIPLFDPTITANICCEAIMHLMVYSLASKLSCSWSRRQYYHPSLSASAPRCSQVSEARLTAQSQRRCAHPTMKHV